MKQGNRHLLCCKPCCLPGKSTQELRTQAEEFTLSEKAKGEVRAGKICKLAGVYLKKKKKTQAILMT